MTHDPVNHPNHYTTHPSGVECIQVTEHMNFNVGNAIKYCFRSGSKNSAIEDLRKGVWYARRELERVSAGRALRGVFLGVCEKRADGPRSQVGSDQERLLDRDVFVSNDSSIRSRDGFRDVCGAASYRDGGIPSERGPARQPRGEPCVGTQEGKPSQEEGARHGAFGREPMVVKADCGAGDLGQGVRPFSGGSCQSTWGEQGSGLQNSPWPELAAYLAMEPEEWRRVAIYCLAAGRFSEAIRAIEGEIERVLS